MDIEYITILEREIKAEIYTLETHISHKSWVKAAIQQKYLEGLSQALHLAMAYMAKKNRG